MVMVSDIKLSVAEVHGCTWPTFFTVNLPNLGLQEEENKNINSKWISKITHYHFTFAEYYLRNINYILLKIP